MDVGQPTLDQLRLFLAVVDEGSFNAAARKLGRAISVVSYGIVTLETQLGVTLFDREGSKRPVLTPAGKAMLAQARAVADDVDALIAGVRNFNQGLEAELGLAIDVMFPTHLVAEVLRDFQQLFPTVQLRLFVEALGAIAAMVVDGRAELGISGPELVAIPDLEREAIGQVELVPVAAPDHPLARMETIPPGEARKHRQLVLTDRSQLTHGQDFSVLSASTWRLGDLGARHALMREGIGWGNMPRHLIDADLAAGRLKRLALPEAPNVAYRFHALWRRDCPIGPARAWVLDALRARLARCPDATSPRQTD
ncbi:LysR substrate-binding domain-containing protein [Novosphingobium jiangmenense]|uniref:LysR family transcriptional regulator n=1 Tax=Novosphingobium jiangmenense TaxID=2791981 RepID=A0ABS0HH43_9SPHN|nr:LysR family transcriptional regulator [Novosphingobium jiangmenense]